MGEGAIMCLAIVLLENFGIFVKFYIGGYFNFLTEISKKHYSYHQPYEGWAFLVLLTDGGGGEGPEVGGGGGAKIPPPPPPSLICHTYLTLMKLSTVIPYLKKIQKIHKLRDTPLEVC